MLSDTELNLVTRACQGDIDAFSQLYANIYQDLYRFALYTLGSTSDAEDVVSDTVLDAFASIHKLRNASSFRAWMFRILSNKCRQVLKGYLHKMTPMETEPAIPDRNYAEIQDVRNAFAQLTERERLIISLTVFAGYSNEEVANCLHINSGTLRSIKSRAMRKLEGILT